MRIIPKLLLAAAAMASPLSAQAPDAGRILEGARLSATLTKIDEGLQGTLTQGRKKVPITLFLRGKNIQFQFTENGKLRVFHMRLADDSYELFEMVNGKTIDFPRAKLIEPIAGTDLTYEDLALRFFYWPNPKLEGTEDVAGQPCYRLRLDKPANAAGRYQGVYVWVHTKYGAFMRIRGHDKNGGLVKEFQVEDVMKISDDTWVLEKMQVATHDPKTGKRTSITDLIFRKPTSGALKGLR
jgi:hypothetical protein